MFMSPAGEIRFVQFNVENLFLYIDKYSGQDLKEISEAEWRKLSSSTTHNKALRKVWALVKTLRDINADVIMLNEVGGEESLTNFAKYFLNDEYIPLIKEGNSNRGIDVGYLIKRSRDVKPVLISHKNRPISFLYPHETQTKAGGKSHYFSRDVSELRLFAPNENSPRLVILLTHLKSKLDPENIDIQGRLRRGAELKALVDIYNEVRAELNHKVPVMVAGDFNGIASKLMMEGEFQYLHDKTDLIEVLEAANRPVEERFSQIQLNYSGKSTKLHIDYIFVSPELKDKIVPEKTGIHFFTNEMGQPLPLPLTMEDRDRLPSDHYPLVLTLKAGF